MSFGKCSGLERTTRNVVDVVYIAACALDTLFTRICVASVRRFYPNAPILLLPGGKLSPSLVRELRRYFGVEIAKIPEGNYGWGFVKLEALFGPRGERFLVLDSDTVMTGRILDIWTKSDVPFLVSNEKPSETDINRIYYNWEKVRQIDPKARAPQFIFNSGQWFGTAGVLTRDDFKPWVEWTMPRRLHYPDFFMPGDQGILNYVVNQKAALDGLRVERREFMLWPGRGMQGLNATAVSEGTAPSFVVHWAGMKKTRHRDMVGSDLLDFFEKQYYRRLPAGGVRIFFDGYKDVLYQWLCSFWVWVRLSFRYKVMARFHKKFLPTRREEPFKK